MSKCIANSKQRKEERRARAPKSEQKFNWKVTGTFATFAEADKFRKQYKKQTVAPVKVRARKDGFRVVVGKPLGKKE